MDERDTAHLAPSLFLSPGPSNLFKHEPLKLDSDKIRLLTVHSELSPNGLIQCFVTHASFLSTDYWCLSYMCGKPNGQQLILVDGKLMYINRTLFNFMQLWRTEEHDPIWIDAICIDQHNVEERNHQVRLMGKIYSKSKLVLAYLGHGKKSIELALDFLSENERMDAAELDAELLLSATENAILNGRIPPTAIIDLAHLPYFRRQWIVQEIVLAPKTIVLYGQSVCAWHTVASLLRQPKICLSSKPKGVPKAMTLAHYFLNRVFPFSRCILMQGHLHGKCSDVHDTVYALLSLTKDGILFPVDYSCTVVDLYFRTLDFCLEEIQDDQVTCQEYCRTLLSSLGDGLSEEDRSTIEQALNALGICPQTAQLTPDEMREKLDDLILRRADATGKGKAKVIEGSFPRESLQERQHRQEAASLLNEMGKFGCSLREVHLVKLSEDDAEEKIGAARVMRIPQSAVGYSSGFERGS